MNYLEPKNMQYKISPESIILKNTKAIISTVKTLEYQMNILENLMRNILEEIRECRKNEM